MNEQHVVLLVRQRQLRQKRLGAFAEARPGPHDGGQGYSIHVGRGVGDCLIVIAHQHHGTAGLQPHDPLNGGFRVRAIANEIAEYDLLLNLQRRTTRQYRLQRQLIGMNVADDPKPHDSRPIRCSFSTISPRHSLP